VIGDGLDEAGPELDRYTEQVYLGACMVLGSIPKGAVVKTNEFSTLQHRLVHNAIIDVTHSGQPLDLITVANRLDANGTMKLVGLAYLSSLLDHIPDPDSICTYARCVKTNAAERRLVEMKAKP
jgi:replicative DNA helicase